MAIEYTMVEYDTPGDILEDVCRVTPGIESPTIMQLHKSDWCSVKSMIKKEEANNIMDKLSEMGCKGIVLTNIESGRF